MRRVLRVRWEANGKEWNLTHKMHLAFLPLIATLIFFLPSRLAFHIDLIMLSGILIAL